MMDDAGRFGNTLRLREESRDVWGWLLARRSRAATSAMRPAPWPGHRDSASPPCSRSRSQPAPPPPSSASSTAWSCGRCRSAIPIAWCRSSAGMARRIGRADLLRGPLGGGSSRPTREEHTIGGPWPATRSTPRIGHRPGRHGTAHRGAGSLAFFSVLGVRAAIGRTFGPQDGPICRDQRGLWTRKYQRDPPLPGDRSRLDGRPFTIVGVMPDSFQFPYGAGSMTPGALPESRTEVWIPLRPVQTSPATPPRHGRGSVVARIRPDATVASATRSSRDRRALAGRARRSARAHWRTPRAARRGRRRPGAAIALDAVRRCRPGAGDRVRQRREPPARAHDRPGA